ncbi:MAG: type II toxin-antitoxin system HipA family toxin [Spirochaetales bacterium]|nr:type II toxin-antitoxin system HipA family toxin [Spirochaetales bacterium]
MKRMAVSDARVVLWGTTIGAVSWNQERELATFQYSPEFIHSGIELSPLMMPLKEFPYEFPSLPREAFKGLPGLLSDSLPDKFGNAVIDSWLASQGRLPSSFTPVERLCYTGKRGMGALEYEPTTFSQTDKSNPLEIKALVELANKVLAERSTLSGKLGGEEEINNITEILRIGTSAGGARAKAIIAWNRETNEFRSGQIEAGDNFEHWLIKFDGVSNNKDKELADPLGYGKIEYAYHLIAKLAGIEMAECHLHEEGGRSHFMTRRFDRTAAGDKLHMQSLGAIAHFDYNQPASYSYEQALVIIKKLNLPQHDLEQQVKRAIFNVIGRNQDDHVKNIAFLMNRQGEWRLSPAYDITYAWDPLGNWTSKHQMSINGKRDNFTRSDLIALARQANIKTRQANQIIDSVIEAFSKWEEVASDTGISESRIAEIKQNLRTNILNK